MPYKLAVQRRRERRRMEKGMKQIAAIGGAVAPPKRVDMLATRTAVDPTRPRGQEKASGIVRLAAVREAQQGAQTHTAAPRSLRPPRLEPGRYAGLNSGQPG